MHVSGTKVSQYESTCIMIKHYTCTDDNTGHRVGQSQVTMTEITEVCVAIVQADTFNYLHH